MRRLAALGLIALLAACETTQAPRPVAVATPVATPAVIGAGAERSRAELTKDDALAAQVSRRIADLDRHSFRAVTVEVWRGHALLMGAVIKPSQRRQAERAAAATDGIAAVSNELVLAEDKALDLFAPDAGLEEAVRRTLGIEGRAGTRVRVVHGVAFLLGAVADTTTAEAMKEDAEGVEGIKWVVNHLMIP